MLRVAILIAIGMTLGATACSGDGSATEYRVSISFNTTYTQEDINETETILRAYDDGLEYLIQESFPPTGVATLETEEADFCETIEPELEAKTYVDAVRCEEAGSDDPVDNPDEPVTNP